MHGDVIELRNAALEHPATEGKAADATAQRADPLFRAHHDTVFRYLRAFMGDEDEALDITALTFERAIRELDRGTADLGIGWLIRTARNAAVDAARRRSVLQRVRERLASPPGSVDPPEEVSIQRERSERVFRAVARLPAPQRDAIALRYSTDLTVREIAPLIGRSESATQKLISRALDRLRENLHDLA